MNYRLHTGDLIAVLAEYPADHFDGMITDPPYGLSSPLTPDEMRACLLAWLTGQPYRPRRSGGFMGKDWDVFIPGPEYWRELFRVLKPGAHSYIYASPRMRGLVEVALSLSGFEVRDVTAWIYGTGFPKSMAIDKAVDDFLGMAEDREVVGSVRTNVGMQGGNFTAGSRSEVVPITAAASDEAKAFEGYGTALKPGWEPCILAVKPNEVGYAVNGILHGVAGLNIDAGRIGDEVRLNQPAGNKPGGNADRHTLNGHHEGVPPRLVSGRFPVNVMFDEAAADLLDDQSGESQSRKGTPRASAQPGEGWGMTKTGAEYNDRGGASRFFYIAKPGRAERDAGLGELPDQEFNRLNPGGLSDDPRWSTRIVKNDHPCVKPIDLNRQLAATLLPPAREHDVRRLIVPFSGSFSEAIGGMLAGWDDVTGVELDPKWEPVSHGRMIHHAKLAGIPIDG